MRDAGGKLPLMLLVLRDAQREESRNEKANIKVFTTGGPRSNSCLRHPGGCDWSTKTGGSLLDLET